MTSKENKEIASYFVTKHSWKGKYELFDVFCCLNVNDIVFDMSFDVFIE
jgi:hypothetical protein